MSCGQSTWEIWSSRFLLSGRPITFAQSTDDPISQPMNFAWSTWEMMSFGILLSNRPMSFAQSTDDPISRPINFAWSTWEMRSSEILLSSRPMYYSQSTWEMRASGFSVSVDWCTIVQYPTISFCVSVDLNLCKLTSKLHKNMCFTLLCTKMTMYMF